MAASCKPSRLAAELPGGHAGGAIFWFTAPTPVEGVAPRLSGLAPPVRPPAFAQLVPLPLILFLPLPLPPAGPRIIPPQFHRGGMMHSRSLCFMFCS